MIILYVKTGCPFSAKAMAVLDAYEVEYELRNIKSSEYLKELMELGGKKQTPFFVDGDSMFYESDRIVNYVETNYGNAATKPKIHRAETGICE